MLLRLILGSIVVVIIMILFVITVRRMIQKIIAKTQNICTVAEKVFGMFLEEDVLLLKEKETITVGNVKVEFSNLQEACDELKRYVNRTLDSYCKHTWIEIIPEWRQGKEKLFELQMKIYSLEKKL